MRRLGHSLKGDTLVEVMLSISVFSFVAVMTINMMNIGVNTAQRTLETEMARNEIDAQAEALRFIHNGVVAERQESSGESQFRKIWDSFIKNSSKPIDIEDTADDTLGDGGRSFDINNMKSCEAAYGERAHLYIYKSFIVNTRLIVPDDGYTSYLGKNASNLEGETVNYYLEKSNKFTAAPLYPRIVYRAFQDMKYRNSERNLDEQAEDGKKDIFYNSIYRAEGVWVDVVGNNTSNAQRSDYYDFYIRTCWHSAGSITPDTITTVVRLYNPEVME